MKIIFALAVLALTCNAIAPRHYRLPTENDELNDRPIVGVFAYPSEFNATYPSAEYSYIAASYVKWVEQSGARVMPIPFDLSDVELKSMFSKINGVLFPGGFWNIYEDQDNEQGLTDFAIAAKRVLDLAIEANYNGDYFPIYGIQSGMQLICALLNEETSPDQKLFFRFKLQNMGNNLEFMRYAQDAMWSNQDDETIQFTATNRANFFYSNFSMSVKNFLRSDRLRNTFDITALSSDDNGQKFIAAIQGKDLPIYGTQFFAQGNIFEWKNYLKLDHHPLTIDFNQQLANFFVQDSRWNLHTYRVSDDQDELLIYNFNPVKLSNDFFEQLYFLERGTVSKRLARANQLIASMAAAEPKKVAE